MTESALTVRENVEMSIADTMTLGKVLAESGFFSDSRQASQAVVKVLAGRELGFGPIASMTGVNIIQGRVAISANLMAAAVKRSGRYDYRVIRLDDAACELECFELGKPVGRSVFDMADARKAGTKNTEKYPRNMLFARAISNLVKWYCPDVTNGPAYTPEELGAVVDNETGEVISQGPTWTPATVQAGEEVHAEPPDLEMPEIAPAAHDPNARPWSAEMVRAYIRKTSGVWDKGQERNWSDARRNDTRLKPPSEGQVKGVAAVMADAVATIGTLQEELDNARHAILDYTTGVLSTGLLSGKEATAFLDLWKVDGAWNCNEYARNEAAAVILAYQLSKGQQTLPLPPL
jgi:hypothetical protein